MIIDITRLELPQHAVAKRMVCNGNSVSALGCESLKCYSCWLSTYTAEQFSMTPEERNTLFIKVVDELTEEGLI